MNRKEQAAIQSIAEKVGEQISELLLDSLSEMFFLMKENRKQPTVQQAPRPDEFLTAIEIAGVLKISKAQACQLLRTRVIPSFSVGRTVRVRRDDLDAFIQAHMVR